jgi:DNA-directed RNA polymerase subunit RPC12/RpoP
VVINGCCPPLWQCLCHGQDTGSGQANDKTLLLGQLPRPETNGFATFQTSLHSAHGSTNALCCSMTALSNAQCPMHIIAQWSIAMPIAQCSQCNSTFAPMHDHKIFCSYTFSKILVQSRHVTHHRPTMSLRMATASCLSMVGLCIIALWIL